MFVNLIINQEVQEFMEKYVKAFHLENKHIFEDATVRVTSLVRDNSALYIVTRTSDKTGFVDEKWKLTSFKGLSCKEDKTSEITNLTKCWSRFIYKTLQSKQPVLAKEYKYTYNEYISREKETSIAIANEKYNELVM